MGSIAKIRRLLSLLELLQSGREYSSTELSTLCRISRRTVFRDLKTLQDAGVPILYDSKKQGYWIVSQPLLPATNLSIAETLSLLVLAQDSTRGNRVIPFQEAGRDAAIKLQSSLPAHLSQYVSDMTQVVKIESEPLADLSGSRSHFETLLAATSERRKVRIVYRSFAEQKTIQSLISPYRILFKRHAWYVIGRSSLHRSVRTFHLGRIERAELTEDSFSMPPRFRLDRYFGNAWSFIREPKARETVVVRFQPQVAENVAEVSWHPTQKIIRHEDGSIDFQATVDGINEISWWIMSYGDQAKVLRPHSLIELIQRRAQNIVEQYASSPSAESTHLKNDAAAG
ncbi:helix-turn-helix transcriptional regulator [Planctomicrobium sp. SH668]|uniref:helix-turn-helix transcriptional regulator n=1 Tax=Planctomicrobium sp. SH668 TaxID=3448126 RepID=UPI003F5B7086